MPKRPENLKKEHWDWILHVDHREGMERHVNSDSMLRKIGFTTMGYWSETQQRALKINNDLEKLKLIKKYFHLIKPSIVPITCKDPTQGKEVGIKIMVIIDEDDNETPVIYIHKSGTVHLYKSRYQPFRKFSSFYEFIDRMILKSMSNREDGL